MTNPQARQIVYMHLRSVGCVVYTTEQEVGQRSIPDLIAMDRRDGRITRYRVMVGKKGGRYIVPGRVGLHADAVAIVNGLNGEITFRACEPLGGPPPSVVTPGPRRAERDQRTGRFSGAAV